MFYDTKIELMLRLGKCFKIGTIDEALTDFTKNLHHFNKEEEMESFKEQVNEEFSLNGITDVNVAIEYIEDQKA